jgi:PAS domain S-box-containing protein
MRTLLGHRTERIAGLILLAVGSYLAWVIIIRNPNQWLLLMEMFLAAVVIGGIGAWGVVRHRAGRTLGWLSRQVRQCTRGQDGEDMLLDVPSTPGEWAGPMSTDLAAIRAELHDLRKENHVLRISNRMAVEERKHIEEVMLHVSDAVLVINSYGELLSANESVERLLGFRLSRASRKPVEDILPGGSLARQIAEACRSGKIPSGGLVEHCLSRDGHDRTYRAAMHVLRGPRQVRQGLIVVLHDISREKEFEQSKAEFLSNVSHELKTPLSSIKAYLELLLDGEAKEQDVPQFHQIIASQADRLERLIDQTLTRISHRSVDFCW